jgi:CheY-like chemotaxis protein
MKIMIAEDEPNTLMVLRLVLEHRGHQVITATDGEQCINVYRTEFFACARREQTTAGSYDRNIGTIEEQPFDVVVLDYRMPKKTGMETAAQILRLNPKQRILFASAHTPSIISELAGYLQDKEKCIEWLQKPFDMALFADFLENSPKCAAITNR